MKKKVCVFTGSRAEYGLLRPLLEKIKQDGDFGLSLLVSGMHLSKEFGLTYREIEEDGFVIDEKVPILGGSDSPVEIAKAVGRGVTGFAGAIERLRPGLMVILGDRFEALACAVSASLLRVPIAHIHGGEITQGALDDAFRHAITKLSRLHFTATEEYSRRVIQLGEEPDRVFCVGALGIDSITRVDLLSKEALEKELGIRFVTRNLLVTVHPETLGNDDAESLCRNLLGVLDGLGDTAVVFTRANADTGGKRINDLVDRFVEAHPDRAYVFTSMGQRWYLSTMRHVDAVVGNSSSGIIEAPFFKIGTINIGDRQKGRIRAESVIDCGPRPDAIREAFKKLYTPAFKRVLERTKNPYGDGTASEQIMKVLKSFDPSGILQKKFYDL
ncbi:MAG: UDP-N-acetylglucosamine 2-epimerase (hydrolyzing) [Spirochaetes bacterium]|nr:UDP-N-acetylglucosamine 2-epimerase (hydrolyzing) [Spirochaetota bacterium]